MPVSAASSCRSPQAFFMHFFMIHLRPVERPGVVSWSPRMKKKLYQRAKSERTLFETFCAITMGAESLPEKQIRGEILICLLGLSSRAEPVATACPKQCGNQRGCGNWQASMPVNGVRRESSTSKSYYQVSAGFFDQHERKHQRKKENSWCLTLTANCNIIAQEGLAGVVTGVCSG